jgi:transposase-like protein
MIVICFTKAIKLEIQNSMYVLVSQGSPVSDAIRQIGVTEVTYYRWRQEYGGLKLDQVKRLKELELENARLRKAVSDLTLDKLILKEAARGNY